MPCLGCGRISLEKGLRGPRPSNVMCWVVQGRHSPVLRALPKTDDFSTLPLPWEWHSSPVESPDPFTQQVFPEYLLLCVGPSAGAVVASMLDILCLLWGGLKVWTSPLGQPSSPELGLLHGLCLSA